MCGDLFMKYLKTKPVGHAGVGDCAFLRIMEASIWARRWIIKVLEVTQLSSWFSPGWQQRTMQPNILPVCQDSALAQG